MRHALLCLSLLLSTPAFADTIIGSISLRTVQAPGLLPPMPEISLDAIVTLEPTSEPVWVSRFSTFLNQPGAHRITSLVGTFNGAPTALEPWDPPLEARFSWALPSSLNPTFFNVGLVRFSEDHVVFVDSGAGSGPLVMFEVIDGFGTRIDVGGGITVLHVPEPASAWLLHIGIAVFWGYGLVRLRTSSHTSSRWMT